MGTPVSPWRTRIFRELARPLADVLGARTAKDLAQLRLATVGDLLRHLPRRYLSGTELTDLSTLLSHFGVTSGAAYEDGDLNGDGAVNLTDLSTLLAVFGTACG